MPGGRTEVVLNLPGSPGKIKAFDPDTGKELWSCQGIPDGYVCPSVISHNGIVYAIGGRKNTAVAVKAGGQRRRATALDGQRRLQRHLAGLPRWLHLLAARINRHRLLPRRGHRRASLQTARLPGAGRTYASGVIADGKIYYVSQNDTTYVLPAKPKFAVLATNKVADSSRTNASPVVDGSRLLIRTDKHLYCVGKN